MKTRIAFADDHPTVLLGVASLFSESEFEIVGRGRSADEIAECAAHVHPDIVVIDLSMPGDVYGAIRQMSDQEPPAGVVVFTAYANVEFARKAFEAGARGFVLKGRPADDLFAAIEAVRGGDSFVSPGFADKFERAIETGERPALARLSRREAQIVDGLLEGKTNREIADRLNLTEKTIKHYMTNVMSKLQVKNRVEVVLAARSADALYEIDGSDTLDAGDGRTRD